MPRRALAYCALVFCALLAVSSSADPAFAGRNEKSLIVGAKDFPGAQILSQIWGQALAARGYAITVKDNIGATEDIFPALENGEIDAYGEYQGTLLETQLGGTSSANRTKVYAALKAALASTGVVASAPAPAVDVNGFYVTKATAKKYKLTTVSDLARVSSSLVFGGPEQCADRDPCLGPRSQALYGLQFKEVQKLDSGGEVTTRALKDGDIDVALLFTGSSVIPKNAVLLKDDKGLQPADNPVLLIRTEQATPALLKVVNRVSAKLTTAAYNEMALKVFNQKEDPADVAAAFLAKNHLN